jgi:hypothetical protein
MALEFTRPVTEWVPENVFFIVKRGRRADNLTAICELII